MILYLRRAFPALVRQSRTLYALTTLGVALGVASVVSIQAINRSALAAFSGSVKAVSGDATLSVRGRGAGVDDGLDEGLLDTVLADRDVTAAWPLILQNVAVAGTGPPGQLDILEVVGIDIFAPIEYPLSTERVEAAGARVDPALLADTLAQPGWVALTPTYAAERGLDVGDSLSISSGSRAFTLHLGALVDFQKLAPLASRKIALMDIAQAQALLGRKGRITQIDLVLAPKADIAAAQARLAVALGGGVDVVTPEQRREDAAGLLAAFRLNLTALSLISVFVGVFLIFSAIQASLVRRRREFGLLRSLGATRDQVLSLILLEAGLLGLAGTVVGIPLGYLAAQANVDSVSGTLTSIYLLSEIESLSFPPSLAVFAALVGIGGALLGALLPARDMSRRDAAALLAASALQERAHAAAPRLAWLGVAFAVAAAAWYGSGGARLKESGFVLAVGLLVALPLVTPLLLRAVCGHVQPRGLGPGLSVRNLVVRLHTTSFAVAALAVTVSMMVGTTLLIGSFRRTLETWIGQTLQADVFVTSESWVQGGLHATLRPAVVDSLATFPGVAGADMLRRVRARTSGGREIQLSGIAHAGLDANNWNTRVPLLAGDPDVVERRLREGRAVLVSEPLARKEGLAIGDSLALATARGVVKLPVAGIGYDYSTEAGLALMSGATLASFAGPGEYTNLGLYLEPGADLDRVMDHMRATFAGQPLVFRSNSRLRGEILAIFDQTFAVTRILQVMALLIAVCGISLTLVIMARERTSELALLRALGATRGQILRLLVGEGGAMGVAGLLLGLAGGAGLAAILILLINRAYFGWTIRFGLPTGTLVMQAALILAGALAASVHPAIRGSRTAAAELTREDLQ